MPPEQAFSLFTPTGERGWAEGWNPIFPCPTADETEPGTVFTTAHGDQRTTWTVIQREGCATIAYSFVTAGERAGLVTITLEPAAAGSTVTVRYDLTALGSEANPKLRSFAAHYPQFLEHWRESIARVHVRPPASES
jgi:hypothetical protein